MKRQLRVLIVDDELTVCERLSAEMERAGFEAMACSDSTAALEKLAAMRFDVVITDLKMRGPTGLDVLKFVAENHPQTRVIVITGFATIDTAKQVMRGGAAEFIPKPFKMSQLRELVERIAAEGTASSPSGSPPSVPPVGGANG